MKFREEISKSLTLEFAEAARIRREEGMEVYSLGLGEPDFRTPQYLIDEVNRVLNKGNSKYSSPLGIYNLRKAISEFLNNSYNIITSADQITVTPGAKQALQIVLMALLEPMDEVIMISPSYVSFIPQIYLAEPTAIIQEVPLNKDDFSLDIKKLEEKISTKTKAILINSPHNPTGSMLTKEEILGISEIAKKNNIYVISDEVYSLLNFSGKKHFSIGAIDGMGELTFTINGLSKSHAMTGWRIGYFSAPKKFMTKVLKIQQHINTNTCSFIQEASLLAFKNPPDHLKEYNNKLLKRTEMINNYFKSHPSSLKLSSPQGGFFAFFNISGYNMNSNEYCARLIKEKGVALTPGIAFGEAWDQFVRLSFAVEDEILKGGLEKMFDFLTEL